MYKNFNDILKNAQNQPKRTIAVADAANEKMMHVVKELLDTDLCNAILVGNSAKIKEIAEEIGVDTDKVTVVNEENPELYGVTAAAIVSSGKADVLVKGKMNTSDFLRAVLNKDIGLRSGRKLSVLTCYEVPKQEKLFFMTDGGMIVEPDLNDKADILRNAVPVLHNMGIEEPKVALLSANEKVSASMKSSVDADELVKMASRGELPKAVYEGPIAFDVAMKKEAADEKGIKSMISGEVDLLLVPNIETGNCLGKSISYFGGGQTAGIVIGATRPVVMSSRTASVKGKLTSIAWALLACGREE